jgi:hypothetical protein
MKFTQLSHRFIPTAGVIAAISLSLGSTAQPVGATPIPYSAPFEQAQLIFNTPQPPDYGNPDGRQRGGASRGPCRNYESLTAIVPLTDGKVWGLTTASHPTFWFYLPYPLTADTDVEFTVQDNSDNAVYSTRFTAPDTASGLMGITIPTTADALNVDQSYQWLLTIYCDPINPFASVSVSGTIQRATLSRTQQSRLASATPLEQANVYAAGGIWYDAFNALAILHPAAANQPPFIASWTDLLQQGNLESLVTQPLTTCCIPQSPQTNPE